MLLNFSQSQAQLRMSPQLTSYQQWRDYERDLKETLRERERIESALIRPDHFVVSAFCYPCATEAALRVDYRYAYRVNFRLVPNWREQLFCPGCGLNNRMRAAVHLLEQVLAAQKTSAILSAEQLTPLFQWLGARYARLTGFEYLGDKLPAGCQTAEGIRNESLTALTFESATFDYVLAFDVLEHIPDYRLALSECLRVLRPGGKLLLSVPFLLQSPEHLVRARVNADGEPEHLLPPEYHGDPLSDSGCLAFYHYGWRLLDDLQAAGFRHPAVLHYWSDTYGYLGQNQSVIVATA